MRRWLLVCLLAATTCAQEDSLGVALDSFDFEAFDPELIELEQSLYELHGRADLTLQYSDGLTALRDRRSRHAVLYSAALSLALQPSDWFLFLAELEIEGVGDDDFSESVESVPRDDSLLEIEFDQLFVELELDGFELALGWRYVPFGIERHAYSSVRNRFVDRPTPFQVIYPGTYSDTGLFLEIEPGALSIEAAITSGLEGADRDGRPDMFTWNTLPPQFAARIGYEPGDDIEVGVSGLVTWLDDDFSEALWLLGLDARLELGRWSIRGEALFGRVSPSTERFGYYLEAVYTQTVNWDWLERAWYGARYDAANPDRELRRLERTQRGSLVLGLGFSESFFLKLQLEVVALEESGNVGGGVQLQLGVGW